MASIRKRGEYQWEARVRRKGYPVQCQTYESYEEAEQWAVMVESEMVRKVFRSLSKAERTMLKDLLEKYKNEISPSKRGGTKEASKLNVISSYKFTQHSVVNISGKELAEYRDLRLKEGKKPKTVRDKLNLLSHVFSIAMKEWGFTLPHGNPVDEVNKPSVGKSNEHSRRLVGDEEQKLAKACSKYGGMIGPIVDFAIETAIRRGELSHLDWKYLDLSAHVAWLPGSITKNGEERGVPLSPKAIRILKSIPRNINGNVFGMRADSITKAFERVCQRAVDENGLDAPIEDLRFHDLRHEATTRLAEEFSIQDLAKITGHKTLQMVMRYYQPDPTGFAQHLHRKTNQG